MPEGTQIGVGYITVNLDDKFSQQLKQLQNQNGVPGSSRGRGLGSQIAGSAIGSSLVSLGYSQSMIKAQYKWIKYYEQHPEVLVDRKKRHQEYIDQRRKHMQGLQDMFGDPDSQLHIPKPPKMPGKSLGAAAKGFTNDMGLKGKLKDLTAQFRQLSKVMGGIPGAGRLLGFFRLLGLGVGSLIAGIALLGAYITWKLIKPFKAIDDPVNRMKNAFKYMASTFGQILLSALPFAQMFTSWADALDSMSLKLRKYADTFVRFISTIGYLWNIQFAMIDAITGRPIKAFKRLDFYIQKISSKNPFTSWAEATDKIKKNIQFFGLEEAFRMAQFDMSAIKNKFTVPKDPNTPGIFSEPISLVKTGLAKVYNYLSNMNSPDAILGFGNTRTRTSKLYDQLISTGFQPDWTSQSRVTMPGSQSFNESKTISLLEQIAKNTLYTPAPSFNVFSGTVK